MLYYPGKIDKKMLSRLFRNTTGMLAMVMVFGSVCAQEQIEAIPRL